LLAEIAALIKHEDQSVRTPAVRALGAGGQARIAPLVRDALRAEIDSRLAELNAQR
jgi:HEAT repeat protein